MGPNVHAAKLVGCFRDVPPDSVPPGREVILIEEVGTVGGLMRRGRLGPCY